MNKQNCGELVEKLKKVQTLNADFNAKAGKALSFDTSRDWNEEESALITEAGKVGEENEQLLIELEKSIGPDSISAMYICKDKNDDGSDVETSEAISITIDFEKKLEYSVTFYKNHHIEIPDNFREIMSDIWSRNIDVIKKSIEEQGFDEILLIPGDTSVADLNLKMSEGYAETYQSENFKAGGSFEGVIEKTKEPRIVLIHKNNAQKLRDRPEFQKTLGQKAEDLIKSGQTLTLTDYLIYQRQFFEETGNHLDESGWTWTPGSTVKNPGGGFRVVIAVWRGGRLGVYADDPDDSSSRVGCRLSRCLT
jgi:hypothetical protein